MSDSPVDNESSRASRAMLFATQKWDGEIAQSVHDTLCQTLGAASMMVKVLAAKLRTESSTFAEMDELEQILDRALDEARHIFTELQPIAPGRDGLMAALARLAEETSGFTPCQFECEDPVLVDNPHVAITLYRIAVEAVRNAVNHAKTKHVKITLDILEGLIVMKIWGDGCSAYLRPLDEASRATMEACAKAVGGRITSESAGGGTTLIFTVKRDF